MNWVYAEFWQMNRHPVGLRINIEADVYFDNHCYLRVLLEYVAKKRLKGYLFLYKDRKKTIESRIWQSIT